VTTRDLSQSQEWAIAALVFGCCALFVLARLGGAWGTGAAVLAFILPIATVKLARSLALTEAAVIARRGEPPTPVTHQTLGLGAPPGRRLGGGPQRVTTVIAFLLGTTGTQFALRAFPSRPHHFGPAPVLFAFWCLAVAVFIFYAVPRQIARGST
jgi:hypothetical protein